MGKMQITPSQRSKHGGTWVLVHPQEHHPSHLGITPPQSVIGHGPLEIQAPEKQAEIRRQLTDRKNRPPLPSVLRDKKDPDSLTPIPNKCRTM